MPPPPSEYESRAIADETRRRHPKPLTSSRTKTQVKAALEKQKCDGKKWRAVRVQRSAANPRRFDIIPRVVPPPDDDDIVEIPAAAPRTKGRLRKQLSAHAQVISWLRTNDWGVVRARAGVPNVLFWLRQELQTSLLLPENKQLTASQRRALPASLRRFRSTLSQSVGHADAVALFLAYISTSGLMGGVGSLLPKPSTRAFASPLPAFAQLVKITKNLYCQLLVMRAKMKEVAALAKCGKYVGKDFLKRLRGVWGLFHRVCMPAIVYVRAWCEYFGLRLHGTPYGPLFWLNLWAYYVRNALFDVAATRQARDKDLRHAIEGDDTMITDFTLVLDATALHKYIDKHLHAPLPKKAKQLADDHWQAENEYMFMPGPPPEYSRKFSLQTGWKLFIDDLPVAWRTWLGTKGTPRYMQYELVDGRLTTGHGTDVEKSVMFRFDGDDAIVHRPPRRRFLEPPTQLAIAPFLFREIDDAE